MPRLRWGGEKGFSATVRATFSSKYPSRKAQEDLDRFSLNPSQPSQAAAGLVQIEKGQPEVGAPR